MTNYSDDLYKQTAFLMLLLDLLSALLWYIAESNYVILISACNKLIEVFTTNREHITTC